MYKEGFFEDEHEYESTVEKTIKLLKNDSEGPVTSDSDPNYIGKNFVSDVDTLVQQKKITPELATLLKKMTDWMTTFPPTRK